MRIETFDTFTARPIIEATDLPPVYALRAFGEAKAVKQLEEQKIVCWAPTYQRARPGPRKTVKMVDTPLIGGYVFARLRPEDFAAAMATERVYGVVSHNGSPVAIPEADWVRVIVMVMKGTFDDKAPATKARPRGARKKGLASLTAWFAAYEQGA